MHRVIVPLNQQQLELVDRAVAAGIAADRASQIRHALRELAASDQSGGAANKETREP